MISQMAVQVLEAMSIHETALLGLIVGVSTGGDGLAYHFIYVLPAVAR